MRVVLSFTKFIHTYNEKRALMVDLMSVRVSR